MGIVLDELTGFFQGLGPTLGQILGDADTLTQTELKYVDVQTALIEDARTVLDTQVAGGDDTRAYFMEWADFVETMNELSPTIVDVFKHGTVATSEVTRLLRQNQEIVPFLLGNFLTLTELALDHMQGLKKVLTLLPYAQELTATTVRYCDEVDPKTGRAIEATCHYDSKGNRIYAIYQADQGLVGKPAACTRGYEGTVRHYPDGTPIDGGPRQTDDSPTNMHAECTAPPTSDTPNVRGAQNADH
jgi:phospholipid/cholesterol/gamma-HCH transport system substrate-binding protein